jgi:hypothetical protein
MSKADYSVTAGIMELPSGKCFEVGSHEWWNWVTSNQAGSFRFECDFGVKGYRARKEEIKSRSGSFWYAYKRVDGTLRKRYLGKSDELTLERLESVAYDLAKPREPRQLEPELPNKSIGNSEVGELREALQQQQANALERENCYQQLLEQKIRLEKQVQELKGQLNELHNTLGNQEKDETAIAQLTIYLDEIGGIPIDDKGKPKARYDQLAKFKSWLEHQSSKTTKKALSWEERVDAVMADL